MEGATSSLIMPSVVTGRSRPKTGTNLPSLYSRSSRTSGLVKELWNSNRCAGINGYLLDQGGRHDLLLCDEEYQRASAPAGTGRSWQSAYQPLPRFFEIAPPPSRLHPSSVAALSYVPARRATSRSQARAQDHRGKPVPLQLEYRVRRVG
jgi:hypothetical protein